MRTLYKHCVQYAYQIREYKTRREFIIHSWAMGSVNAFDVVFPVDIKTMRTSLVEQGGGDENEGQTKSRRGSGAERQEREFLLHRQIVH